MVALGFSLGFMTIMCIFTIVISQYLCVVQPIKYRNGFRLIYLITGSLLVTFMNFILCVLSVFVYSNFGLQKLVMGTAFMTLLGIMVFCFVHMPIAVRKSRQKVSVVSEEVILINRTRVRNIKLAKTAFFILFGFLVCYGPLVGFVLVNREISYFSVYVEIPLNIIAMSNSVVDFFVYYWRVGAVRNAIRNVFQPITNTRSHEKNPSSSMHSQHKMSSCSTHTQHKKISMGIYN